MDIDRQMIGPLGPSCSIQYASGDGGGGGWMERWMDG